MAREEFQKEVNRLIDKLETTDRAKLPDIYAHRLVIRWRTIAEGMSAAVDARAKVYGTDKSAGYKSFNSKTSWTKAAKDAFDNMRNDGSIKDWSETTSTLKGFTRATNGHKGVWVERYGTVGVSLVVVAREKGARIAKLLGGFDTKYRRNVWREWIKQKKLEVDKFLPVTTGAPKAQEYFADRSKGELGPGFGSAKQGESPFGGDNLPSAHKLTIGQVKFAELWESIEEGSTNNQALDDLGFFGKVATPTSIQNVKQQIIEGLDIKWKQERIPDEKGEAVEVRIITVEVDTAAANLADRQNDLDKLKPNAKKVIKDALENLITTGDSALAKADLKTSKTYRDAAGEVAANQIMKSLIKGGKKSVKVVKRKKPSGIKINRRGTAKKGKKATKISTTSDLIVSQAPRIRARGQSREKGKAKELNLGTLKAQINRRLPAEVRRNMGRPALINRTGRFSDSVEITSIRQTKNTLTADYTYQLRPYETFENTGQIEWPAGYNPKPLIAKSIRNLALNLTDQKFTLRRV